MAQGYQSQGLVASVLWIAIAISLTACGGQSSGSNLQLSILPEQASVKPGGQQLFSASIKDSQGQTLTGTVIHWSSSNSQVATVSGNGLAAALQEGTTQIAASAGGESATATLQVSASAVRPAEIVDVIPPENYIVSLSGPCPHAVPPCAMPQLGAVGADVSFPGEDIFESARLFLNGTEITSNSVIDSTGVNWIEGGISTCTPVGNCTVFTNIEAGIFYNHLLELPVGSYQATVEAKSQAGQTVTYTWSFTITK